jgi:hypothetical protein
MNINFALEYIPRRMKELGYGDNYIIRTKLISVRDESIVTIEAQGGEFFLLVQDYNNLIIESDTGYYKQGTKLVTEQQYEHQGEIKIENTLGEFQYVRFIQVIPTHVEKKCETKNNCSTQG